MALLLSFQKFGWLRLIFLSLLSLSFFSGGLALASPIALKHGRWVGTFSPPQQEKQLGVVFDVFLSQPSDLREFPRLEAVVKASLGGTAGAEFDSWHFENIQYDFNSGELTFDESSSDLVIHAKVTSPRTIEGTLSSALTGVSGRLYLSYVDGGDSAEPCDPEEEDCQQAKDPWSDVPKGVYLPHLSGKYSGNCGNISTQLELSAVPSLGDGETTSDFLKSHTIVGRLGQPSALCTSGSGNQTLCVIRSYHSASFNLFSSSLTLHNENTTDTCRYGKRGDLDCQLALPSGQSKCVLYRQKNTEELLVSHKRQAKLSPLPEQMVALPQEMGTEKQLSNALGGTFSGYLFHELDGRYQPLQIASTSTLSTDNPHNEPSVFIGGTAKLYLGRSFQAPFLGFKLGRRTFALSKGMSLRSEDSDLIFVVDIWRAGFISGTAYSIRFGRVGPFEVLKSSALPSLPENIRWQPQLSGRFASNGESGRLPWHFEWQSRQENELMTGFAQVVGTAALVAPGMPVPKFAVKGNYDIFQNRISLQTEERNESTRVLSGRFNSAGDLELGIPSSSAWGTRMSDGKPIQLKRTQN